MSDKCQTCQYNPDTDTICRTCRDYYKYANNFKPKKWELERYCPMCGTMFRFTIQYDKMVKLICTECLLRLEVDLSKPFLRVDVYDD